MTIAYMVGISGRNFGSEPPGHRADPLAGIPAIAAVLSVGNIYYTLFALVLLLPFFVSLKFISDRLRRTLLDAVIAQRDMSLLAKRFDTALNNMPHGLCMFDAAAPRWWWRMRKLSELLGVQSPTSAKARPSGKSCATASTPARSCAPRRRASPSKSRDRLSGEDNNFMFETPKGRSLHFTFQPMENGGSVVLVEDITERKAAEARIKHLARYDPLTDLPNRNFLRDQMDQALAQLDGPVRSRFSSSISTSSSRSTTRSATRAATCCCGKSPTGCAPHVRETDIVARFGGDEFVVLQTPVSSVEEAATMAAGSSRP